MVGMHAGLPRLWAESHATKDGVLRFHTSSLDSERLNLTLRGSNRLIRCQNSQGLLKSKAGTQISLMREALTMAAFRLD